MIRLCGIDELNIHEVDSLSSYYCFTNDLISFDKYLKKLTEFEEFSETIAVVFNCAWKMFRLSNYKDCIMYSKMGELVIYVLPVIFDGFVYLIMYSSSNNK